MTSPYLSIRLATNGTVAMGPGKAVLLDAIIAHQSISAAAKSMEMSYRRAWQLVDLMNQTFHSPVVETVQGGVKGGGAIVTPFGMAILQHYRALVTKSQVASQADFLFLSQAIRATSK